MHRERRALAALHIAKPIRLGVRIYFLIFLVMAGQVFGTGRGVARVFAILVGKAKEREENGEPEAA